MSRPVIRRALGLTSFLLFPVTIFYFSPVLSLGGASLGIAAGSLIVFGVLTVGSLFLGRAFCGWLCPTGFFQELLRGVRDRPLAARRVGWIKFMVWIPWLATLIIVLLRAGGIHRVEFLFGTTNGLSVAGPLGYIVYFSVLGTFAVLALAVGRRAGCHTLCWVAPFMIVGRRVRNLFGWPALRLEAASGDCIACGACDRKCPMGIAVQAKVRAQDPESLHCTLCGECVDACPKSVLSFRFAASRGK